MNFYDIFLELCNQVKKTPSRVILEVGGTKSAITRWKNGGMPTDATAKKIADYFGVTTDYLLGREPRAAQNEEKPATQEGDRLSELQSEIMTLVQDAPEETQREFLNYLLFSKAQREK